ncbi:MAG: DUF362 domain-containing protein [Verrucomicrobia bacterium]|nr:DUF362 domain-containing protein [Verrucomicrobiota bacterium]
MKKGNKVSLVDVGDSDYADSGAVRVAVFEALDQLALADDFFPERARVVLKPNWVKEHDERQPGPDSWPHVVTHPLVIESVAAYVGERLPKGGSVIICDAPQTDSSFQKLREYCGLDAMISRLCKHYPDVSFELLDLRPEEWNAVDGVTVSKTMLNGDPAGSTHVTLNEASEFVGFQGQGKLFGASFDMEETNLRHSGTTHEYLLCRTPMEADVFINIPKLKTHKKVGLTCALKNLVGINANKNWLPHHTEGTPDDGGDQFPANTSKARLEHQWMGRIKRFLTGNPGWSRIFVPLKKVGRMYFGDTQKVVRSGNWYGNDTCWRMVLDLNKCLYFFDGAGKRRHSPPKYLAVVDGILGGEGNGPMAPDPVKCGAIIAGTHPVAVDMVAAKLMGFNYRRIRMLDGAFRIQKLSFVGFSPEDIEILSPSPSWRGPLKDFVSPFNFRPHFGWENHIEEDIKATVE